MERDTKEKTKKMEREEETISYAEIVKMIKTHNPAELYEILITLHNANINYYSSFDLIKNYKVLIKLIEDSKGDMNSLEYALLFFKIMVVKLENLRPKDRLSIQESGNDLYDWIGTD